MSSSIDENIELLELTSTSPTKSYIKTKLKPDNKVGLSPVSSPAHENTKTHSFHHFNAKPPVPKPRKVPPVAHTRHTRRLSKTTSEITCDSPETINSIKESIFSSKSDTKSYRERFKERFESVKKQAGKSVSKAHTLKTNRDNVRYVKRNLHLLKRENKNIENVLQKYQNEKEKKNEKTYTVSKIEAYDFFCKNEEEHVNKENRDDNNARDKDVLITVTNDLDDNIVQFQPPENLHHSVKLAENNIYWQPSRKRPQITEKIELDEPRSLAEEGFYLSEKPRINSSHLAILEQQLLSIDDKKWFNCEGELNFLPNPLTQASYKPYLYKVPNENLKVEYVPAMIDAYYSDLPDWNMLDVSILSVKFKHHPLFSTEHVLEQQLYTLYDSYKQYLNRNKLERIKKHLNALRNTKKQVQAILDKNSEINLKKWTEVINDIRKLRKLYFEENKHMRQTLKSILHTWKEIKIIRHTNNYCNTEIKLNIRKEKCSYEQEKREWNENIAEVSNEIVEEYEVDFQIQMENYEKQLEKWRSEDPEHSEEEMIDKPKKPRKNIDHEVITQEVRDMFQDCLKPPGEPILHFRLSYDNVISTSVENIKEKLRRQAVLTTKVFLKIFCNKIEVCKTKPVVLTDKFVCIYNESFSIKLFTVPEYILIEIHEQPNSLLKRKYGEIKVAIPPRNTTIHQSKIVENNFEKDEIIHYKHEGVGSGIRLNSIWPKSNVNENEMLNTSGILLCKIGWDLNSIQKTTLEEVSESEIMKEMLKEDGTVDIRKVVEWTRKNNPDPQDPKNSSLFEYITNYEEDLDLIQNFPKTYFRCNPEMSSFEFCKAENIEENIRFKILELRDKNEPEFVGMVVPNRVKEIPSDILTDYNKRLKEEVNNLMDEDYAYNEDEIDSKRNYGRKYLKRVYTKVFQQCCNAMNNLNYEDVVNEKSLPHIQNAAKNIISNILNWFIYQPTINIKKPLINRKPSLKLTHLSGPVSIIINVSYATNVPTRNPSPSVKSVSDKDLEKTDVVKPFISITYQNIHLKTAVLEGTNPIYNEKLFLPLETANIDYLSPNSLCGAINIHLFDEIIMTTRNGQTKGKNWLGSIEIPISAVAYNNKIEGLFKLQKPTNLLGYENASPIDTKAVRTSQAQDTCISLKLSIHPNIPKLTHSMDELETNELAYIKQHIMNWNEAYNNEYPNRKFNVLVIDITGKTTCLTRFIRRLEPPQLNPDRFDVAPDQCARYVSMIPFTENNKFYDNVWLSTEQLLKLMVGSIIDHAIALTCYLTSLNLETWLLVGCAIPYGNTAFVLIREYNRESQTPVHFIYDVVTATKYNVLDPLCPLKTIFYIANEHNVWGNVQKLDQTHLTRFDFMRQSDWSPLFTNQIAAPTNSVQHKLIYSVTPDVSQLEIKIDRRIRKKISKLRKHERTVWNHQLSKEFKCIFIKHETNIMSGRRNSEISPDIENFSPVNCINGYIINTPYTTITTILNKVVATGVHLYETIDTELVLAVKIYSYPNHVLVVWICFAALTNTQDF